LCADTGWQSTLTLDKTRHHVQVLKVQMPIDADLLDVALPGENVTGAVDRFVPDTHDKRIGITIHKQDP
jgi:hypothetical protein